MGNQAQRGGTAGGCAPRRPPGGLELKERARRSRRWRGAGQEAGRGKQRQLGLLVLWRPPGGARGSGGTGRSRGRCRVPRPSSVRARSRARRPAMASGRLHDCTGRLHAPLTGRRPNRSAQELVPRAGASASRGTWPGEGSPMRDRACAVARARPSAGKKHAQCEGTLGYVGVWGMLGENGVPAHAQRRSEPATHWWREKREKSPQSYVRKGRVLWGGCGLPRGSALLLGRGA